MSAVEITRWSDEQAPTEAQLRRVLEDEGLHPYRWANAPGDAYSSHVHDRHKVLYVVRGSIAFGLLGEEQRLHLQAGDRLELPQGTAHDAVVGPSGVVCLEAYRG
jgi:quercetin dioxygenase-like cupin family protein